MPIFVPVPDCGLGLALVLVLSLGTCESWQIRNLFIYFFMVSLAGCAKACQFD